MWFLLSLVWKTTLSFSRIIITSVMTAILSAVWISVVWIPIDTAVCAIMSAHFSARKFYFTLLNFVIHLFHLRYSWTVIILSYSIIILWFYFFGYLYFYIIMIHQQIIYITTTKWHIHTFTLSNQCTYKIWKRTKFLPKRNFYMLCRQLLLLLHE